MALKPFTPRKVVNVHTHIKRVDSVEAKVETWKAQGAARTCVQLTWERPDMPAWGVINNAEFLPWLERYPDHLVGFAGVNLSESPDKPGAIGELYTKGFRGLKCIRPDRPYDDDAYMPLYEAAAGLKMPVLFHTGFLSFPEGYRGPCRVDFMRPARLERVVRYFPELAVIGAHLGTPWHPEALTLLEHKNFYCDISGGSASPQRGAILKRALAPFPGANLSDPQEHAALRLFRDKLLFATDNPPIAKWVPRAEDVMDYLGIPAESRDNFYWRTAAKILNLDV